MILCAWILLWLPACQTAYFDTTAHIPTHAVCALNMDSVLMDNDSVGNDWTIAYTCNGRAITDGERFTLPVNTTEDISIKITVTEKDKYPDNGETTAVITLEEGATACAEVTIQENKGRFRGNVAHWQFHFWVKVVQWL